MKLNPFSDEKNHLLLHRPSFPLCQLADHAPHTFAYSQLPGHIQPVRPLFSHHAPLPLSLPQAVFLANIVGPFRAIRFRITNSTSLIRSSTLLPRRTGGSTMQ